MEIKKLVISPKKFRGDSMVVSTRLPIDLVGELDKIADSTGRTRNEIMQICLEFAIENLDTKASK